MKTRMQNLIAAVAVLQLSASFVTAQTNAFSDNFEGASLDPFWFSFANQGSITFPSTAQAHSGSQSVQFNSPANMFNAVGMQHVLATPGYGQVSTWVYDTGAGLPQSHTLDLSVGSGAVGLYYLIAHPAFSTYQFGLGSAGFHDTGITRTPGWHQFAIQSVENSLALSIDGNTVYSDTAAQPFSSMLIRMHGGGPSVSGGVSYWDDFSFAATPVPEPSAFVLLALGAIGIVVIHASSRHQKG